MQSSSSRTWATRRGDRLRSLREHKKRGPNFDSTIATNHSPIIPSANLCRKRKCETATAPDPDPTTSRLVLLGEDPFGDHPYMPKSLPRLVRLSRARTTIGRDPGRCDLVLDSEKYTGTLSRTHCAIFSKAHPLHLTRAAGISSLSSTTLSSEEEFVLPKQGALEWWIEDLNSTNGTFVNGIAMRGTSIRLHNGDIVTLGTNDRNAAELKDGEWWEVERWSDTVFRFECFEAGEEDEETTPRVQIEPVRRLSTSGSSGAESLNSLPNSPILVSHKRRKLKETRRQHMPTRRHGGAQDVGHAFNSPIIEHHHGDGAASTQGSAMAAKQAGQVQTLDDFANRALSSTPVSRPNHATPSDSPKETATRAVFSGQMSPMNQHSGHHTLVSLPGGPRSSPLSGKDGVGRSGEGVGSVMISQYDVSGHASKVAAKLVLIGADRARQNISSIFGNSHCTTTSSSSIDAVISSSRRGKTHASSNGQDRRSSSPSSPPALVSMASPPPRAKNTRLLGSHPPIHTSKTSSSLHSSSPAFHVPRPGSMNECNYDGGTPMTQGGAILGKSEVISSSASALAAPSVMASCLGGKHNVSCVARVKPLLEYEPVGIDHLPTHPLEGETLVCISAESLPPLDPSCAMWGRQRRSQWERRAYREGQKIFVNVQRQLGKGGSALVFTGKMLRKLDAQNQAQMLTKVSRKTTQPLRNIEKRKVCAKMKATSLRGQFKLNLPEGQKDVPGAEEDEDDEDCLSLDADSAGFSSSDDEDFDNNEDSEASSSEGADSLESLSDSGSDDVEMANARGKKSSKNLSAFSSSSIESCFSSADSTEVALKVVTRSDASSISAFWTELDALVSLSRANAAHPHVVRLLGVCFDTKHVIAVISYHRGGPLSKWWKRHRKLNRGQKVGENAVAHVLRGACKALEFCHANGRLHLDVKENNVVFCRGVGDVEKVVLIDFGCAVSVTDTGGKVVDTGYDDYFEGGTFCCMAPEVLAIAVRALRHERLPDTKAPPSFGAKADVWSIGVMAHVLLTGRYPYGLTGDRSDDIEAYELLARIRSGRPWDGARDRRELSPLAQNFLQQVLTIDEDKRLSLEQAMTHPFILEYCGIEKK